MTQALAQACVRACEARGDRVVARYRHTKDSSLEFVTGYSDEDTYYDDKVRWRSLDYEVVHLDLFGLY